MSIAAASARRYAAAHNVAAYLEAEWSDFLFKHALASEKDSEASGVSLHPTKHVTPAFYKGVVKLIGEWASSKSVEPKALADIGGGTGRVAYEWALQHAETEEILYCEPSEDFFRYARWFLLGESGLGPNAHDWIPVVDRTEHPSYCKVEPENRPVGLPEHARKRIRLANCAAENVPRPVGYFDIVCCLNVLDRHQDPQALVGTLRSLVRVGGLLIVATPFDWREDHTPKEKWFFDCREWFMLIAKEDLEWVGQSNVNYDFRYSTRKVVRFDSQVACFVRRR